MKIVQAKIADVDAVYGLINYYAELDRMLFRQKADIYESLQSFSVARDDSGKVVGCCCLQVIWSDIAEIKSLAVDSQNTGRGIGKMLVGQMLKNAENLGIAKVMALTLERKFFEGLGFQLVDRQQLPMKVWSDCARCPKQDHCDEYAYIKEVL